MPISPSNSVNFTGNTIKTKKGNEYKSTNAGAYTGLATGAVIGTGVPTYQINKVLKSDVGKEALDQLQEVGELISQKLFPEDPKALENIEKCAKGSLKAGVLFFGAATALVGLGIGYAVDACINHHRAKKADTPQSAIPEKQPAAVTKQVK